MKRLRFKEMSESWPAALNVSLCRREVVTAGGASCLQVARAQAPQQWSKSQKTPRQCDFMYSQAFLYNYYYGLHVALIKIWYTRVCSCPFHELNEFQTEDQLLGIPWIGFSALRTQRSLLVVSLQLKMFKASSPMVEWDALSKDSMNKG